jgi:hypothetical protein
MEIEKIITVCGVDIPVADGPIGISVSGGADSVALLYALLVEFPQKEFHVYTAIENEADFRILAGPAVSTVLGKIIQRLGHRRLEHHVCYHNNKTEDFPPELIHTQAKRDLLSGKITAVYTGLTATPPLEIAESFTDDPFMLQEIAARDPNVLHDVIVGNFIMPFRNYDKQKVKEFFDHYMLTNWLYPLTFSCENTNNVFENPVHCGECWWCRERQWAFGKLV